MNLLPRTRKGRVHIHIHVIHNLPLIQISQVQLTSHNWVHKTCNKVGIFSSPCSEMIHNVLSINIHLLIAYFNSVV